MFRKAFVTVPLVAIRRSCWKVGLVGRQGRAENRLNAEPRGWGSVQQSHV